MRYLEGERLNAIDRHAFRSQQPFPWVNPYGLLIEDGYQRLLNTLPDRSLFTPVFGKKRADDKHSHDRFSLEYHDDLDITPPWKEFIAELRGKAYQDLLRRLIGARSFELLFYWHYTPRGCSVSPHCDSKPHSGPHRPFHALSRRRGVERVMLNLAGAFGERGSRVDLMTWRLPTR
jgi:hypothetical protein